MGQKIAEQNINNAAAGELKIKFDGSQLSSGIYFYTVKTGNESITKKMIK